MRVTIYHLQNSMNQKERIRCWPVVPLNIASIPLHPHALGNKMICSRLTLLKSPLQRRCFPDRYGWFKHSISHSTLMGCGDQCTIKSFKCQFRTDVFRTGKNPVQIRANALQCAFTAQGCLICASNFSTMCLLGSWSSHLRGTSRVANVFSIRAWRIAPSRTTLFRFTNVARTFKRTMEQEKTLVTANPDTKERGPQQQTNHRARLSSP